MQRRLSRESSLPGQRPYTWTEAALGNQAFFFGLFYIWCLLESNVGSKQSSWIHVALAFALLHPRIHLLVRHVLAPRIHAALAPAAALLALAVLGRFRALAGPVLVRAAVVAGVAATAPML